MSFNDWVSMKLGELIDSVSVRHDFKKEKLIFLNTSDVLEGKVLHRNYSEVATMPGQAKKSIKKDDILFSEIRPKNKRFAYIDFDAKDYVVSTKLMVLRRKSMLIDNKFLYKLLTSDRMLNYLQHIAEGRSGTFPQITFSELKNIEVLLPPIQEQILIAKMLDDLDEKIEVNNKINDNLEKISQAIFKQWFIDFEFPNENGEPYKSSGGEMIESELGEIPKGWKVDTLNNLVREVITGKTPSTKKSENYGDKYPFVTIPDMHNKVFITKTERYLSEEGHKLQRKKLIPKNSIMVSCIATVGLVSISSESVHTNQQINSIIPNSTDELYYFYESLKLMEDKLRGIGSSGSATLNVNKGEFEKIKYIYPNMDTISKYHSIVKNIYEKIKLNEIEKNNIIQIRDTLLPKLMSGEIRVPLEEN